MRYSRNVVRLTEIEIRDTYKSIIKNVHKPKVMKSISKQLDAEYELLNHYKEQLVKELITEGR